MLTDLWPVSRGIAAHLASVRALTIVEPSSPTRRALLAGASLGLRLAGFDPSEIIARLERTSVCLPLGVGNRSLVLLSDHAVSDPVTYAATVSHEAHHDQQEDDGGHVRGAWDYLLSAEIRAKREADAYAVGLWVRYLLTGEVPDGHDALVSLEHGPYHLGPGDIELARSIVESHVASIRSGVCPPLSTARAVLSYLREHHPGAIAPEHLRAVPA